MCRDSGMGGGSSYCGEMSGKSNVCHSGELNDSLDPVCITDIECSVSHIKTLYSYFLSCIHTYICTCIPWIHKSAEVTTGISHNIQVCSYTD